MRMTITNRTSFLRPTWKLWRQELQRRLRNSQRLSDRSWLSFSALIKTSWTLCLTRCLWTWSSHQMTSPKNNPWWPPPTWSKLRHLQWRDLLHHTCLLHKLGTTLTSSPLSRHTVAQALPQEARTCPRTTHPPTASKTRAKMLWGLSRPATSTQAWFHRTWRRRATTSLLHPRQRTTLERGNSSRESWRLRRRDRADL